MGEFQPFIIAKDSRYFHLSTFQCFFSYMHHFSCISLPWVLYFPAVIGPLKVMLMTGPQGYTFSSWLSWSFCNLFFQYFIHHLRWICLVVLFGSETRSYPHSSATWLMSSWNPQYKLLSIFSGLVRSGLGHQISLSYSMSIRIWLLRVFNLTFPVNLCPEVSFFGEESMFLLIRGYLSLAS